MFAKYHLLQVFISDFLNLNKLAKMLTLSLMYLPKRSFVAKTIYSLEGNLFTPTLRALRTQLQHLPVFVRLSTPSSDSGEIGPYLLCD
ncbi:hypothetical protein SRABI70_00875 [Pseudomonas sp. Bi70]|nr:hypothetical protein SRABI70_00875 [Pseudomonas sp. Bi70]